MPAAPPVPSKLFDIPIPTAADKLPTREIPIPVDAGGGPASPGPRGAGRGLRPRTRQPSPPRSWATDLDDNLQGGGARGADATTDAAARGGARAVAARRRAPRARATRGRIRRRPASPNAGNRPRPTACR